MGGLIWGVFDIALGLGLVLAGLRLFVALLPMVAFLVGLTVSGMAFAHLGDEGGMFTTTVSIVVAIGVGIVLAVLSYVLWYVGVLIVAGSVGAMIGSGIMAAFSSKVDVVHLVIALIGAGAALLIAYEFNAPTWVVIAGTSLLGAVAVILGAMLALDRIEVDDLQNGPVLPVVHHSWFWVLAWAGIAALGIGVQYSTARTIAVPDGRWTRLHPESYLRVGRRSTARTQ